MATEHQDQESIVAKAVEIESPAQRDAYIDRVCGGDAELRRQVKEHVEEKLQPPGPEGADGPKPERAGHTESREQPLTRVGPYKVLKLIGEGAAGTLFRAEQQEPLRRTVALRLIKEGADWRKILGRLEAQRQTLESLDHSNIARVLDLGARPSGQPYLVTEWVDGPPITRYCDEKKVALRKRLELFVAVCEAVQYAHQKGIIHGDLEPSKVLVAGGEDQPVPRVLDFGVARAVGRKPTEGASATEPGGLDGRAEYMSPEQADANTPEADARSDVYGLGILLYELLTGTTPLRPERLRDVPATKALQLVREEEPPPPSKRIDELDDDRRSSSAEQRQTQPKSMAKALQGELDCIVMKALNKDPRRRYETPHELARDLQRYLANEPVEACPPSLTARLGKLARKHPRLATTAVLSLLLLLTAALAGTGLALWAFHKEHEAQKAEQKATEKQEKAEKAESKAKGELQRTEEKLKSTTRERDQARKAEKSLRRSEEDMKAVLTFFKDRMLSAGRPPDAPLTDSFWNGVRGQGKDVTLRKAVDEAAAKVAETFADRPSAEAGARELIGLAYLNLGEAAKAVPQYERALALREAMQGANDPQTADCRNQLAVAYRLAGRTPEAGKLFEQNPNTAAHASALAVRGMMLLAEKKPEEAELKLRQCLLIRQKIQPDDWKTFDTKSLVGEALLEQKKYAEAEPLLVSGYEGLKQLVDDLPGPDRGRLPKALERLVRLYGEWGKRAEADRWRKELEALRSRNKPEGPGGG